MAKKTDYYASPRPKPLRSRGYDKLVLLTLIAIGVGCGLFAWEVYVDYGGAIKAPAPVKVKIDPLAPPEKTAPVQPGG